VLVYLNSLLWAGRTATPVLQLHISAFRALETGRDVIHATAGGPSAIIQANGHIQVQSRQAIETTIVGTAQPRIGATLYLIWGDWIGLGCSSIAALIVLFLSVVSYKTRVRASGGNS
jgi:apolipoprotein N-acyltransferase